MPPAQKITLHPKGLYTNVNQLGAVPPGALLESENVVLGRPGVLEVRRGRRTVAFFVGRGAGSGNPPWVAGARPLSLFNATLRVGGDAQNNYLGTPVPGVISMMSDGTMYWSQDGRSYQIVRPTLGFETLTMAPIYGDRHWYGFEQGGSIYIATDRGIVKVGRPMPTSPYGAVAADSRRCGYALAGVPQGIETIAATGNTGTALPTDAQSAYRFCFGYRDANNIVHLGAPSTRTTVRNATGQTRDVTASTTIPPGIVSGVHFWQLYRSLPSSSADTDPGDDLGLVAEGNVPSPLSIYQMSRSGTTLTCRTTAAHGFAAPLPNIIINNGVTIPGVDATNQFSIKRTSASLRTVYKKTLNNGAMTSVGTFNVSLESGGYTDVVAMVATDPVNGRVYYVEGSSRYIYVLNADGTFLNQYDAGVVIDLAVFDKQARSIKIIGRSLTSSPSTFDYNNPTAPGSGRYYCAEFDVVSLATTYAMYGQPFRTFGNIAKVSPLDFAWNSRMGLWKASATATPYWCIAMAGYGQVVQVALSNTKGVTWSYEFTTAQNLSPTSHIGIVSASDTYTDGAQTYFSFAIYSSGKTVPVNGTSYTIYQDAEIYYISNSGYDSPSMQRSNISYSYLSDNNYPAMDQRNIFTSIKCNERNGFIDIVLQWGTQLPPLSPVYDHYMYRLSSQWVPSGAFAPANSFTLGTSTTPLKSMLQDSNVSSGSNGFLVTLADGRQWLDADGTSGAFAFIGTLPEFVSAAGIKGASATVNAYVAPGTYTVLSVIDVNTFTVSSVQSPQVDFPLSNVTAEVLPTEIVFTDTVAPEYLGPYLYSSSVVEGALQSNSQPPLCRDTALFRTTAFYANITQNTVVQITMLKLPVVGQRIYIGNNTSDNFVTAAATENVQAKQFKVTSPGAGVALDKAIQATILSLAKVVNVNWRQFDNLLYPIGIGVTAYSTFFISSIHPADPVLFKHTDASGTLLSGYFSPNELYGEAVRQKNLLAYSKINQPEAVPLTNTLRIGSDSKEILRIFPSRDALFVFKEDGVFIVRGYGPPWQVDPFDLTLQLSVPDSLAALDNAVFGAFTRGVFKITDSNVELLSLPIQNLLEQRLAGDQRPQSINWGFGVGDVPDHKYLLFLPHESNVNDYCEDVYVYDTFTNEWTEWQHPARHALMYKDEKLLFAFQTQCDNGGGNFAPGGAASGPYPSILEENRTLTSEDFFDDYLWRFPSISAPDVWNDARDPNNVSIVGYNPDTLEVTIAALQYAGAYISKWDILGDGIMPAEDGVPGGTMKLLKDPGFQTTPTPINPIYLKVTKGIPHSWKFVQAFPESPAATNHFSEFAVSFREAYWSMLKATFEVPVEQGDPLVHIAPQEVLFLGTKHFGPERVPSKNNYIRTYVPRQCQRGTTLTVGIETGVCKTLLESNGMFIILTQGPTSFQRR